MKKSLEQLVWERAQRRCEYCLLPQSLHPTTFEIDHIRPRKLHGQTVSGNLALSCYRCNGHKGTNIAGYDPETDAKTHLFHPRQDSWSEHFLWNGPILVGRTSIGRTTIDVLQINHFAAVRLREELMVEGLFPPE